MIYVAHPLAGDIPGNCGRAEAWLAALMRDNPDETFCLPWVSYVRAGRFLFDGDNPDDDKEFRDRCLRDDLTIAAECDGIVLCGPRISPGMAEELSAVIGAAGTAAMVWRLSGHATGRQDATLGDHLTLAEARQLLADVRAGVER